jgi:hypothetical protein
MNSSMAEFVKDKTATPLRAGKFEEMRAIRATIVAVFPAPGQASTNAPRG